MTSNSLPSIRPTCGGQPLIFPPWYHPHAPTCTLMPSTAPVSAAPPATRTAPPPPAGVWTRAPTAPPATPGCGAGTGSAAGGTTRSAGSSTRCDWACCRNHNQTAGDRHSKKRHRWGSLAPLESTYAGWRDQTSGVQAPGRHATVVGGHGQQLALAQRGMSSAVARCPSCCCLPGCCQRTAHTGLAPVRGGHSSSWRPAGSPALHGGLDLDLMPSEEGPVCRRVLHSLPAACTSQPRTGCSAQAGSGSGVQLRRQRAVRA